MAPTTETHVVGRVADILRSIGAATASGLSTTQVATSTGLARPTAHRLLS